MTHTTAYSCIINSVSIKNLTEIEPDKYRYGKLIFQACTGICREKITRLDQVNDWYGT